MSAAPDWVPEGIDTTKANIARVYDYWLGGDHNFQADRDAARAGIAFDPKARAVARANRAFLGRAVRFLADQAGIRQFLDIGSGMPTEENVHQVAQRIAPGSRVVYADNDDVVVAHSRLMLQDNPDATIIKADLREPGSILARKPSSCSTSASPSPWSCPPSCTSSPTTTRPRTSSRPCAAPSSPEAISSSATHSETISRT